MNNRLDWLTEDQWTKHSHAVSEEGEDVYIDSPQAVKYDLYGALKVSYYKEEEFEETLEKVKKAYKLLFPDKWESVKETMYYKKEGRIHYVMPLYVLNDILDSFSQVKRLLFYI